MNDYEKFGSVKRLLCRSISALTAASFVASTFATSFVSSATAQMITDPTAPIQFRPSITSSQNGTPTINIVRPSKSGISHNKYREYNIDTRGVIHDDAGNITTKSVASTVGLSLSWWKKEQYWSESQTSELIAGNDIVMKAGLDVVLDQGTRLIAGNDVVIDAKRDIMMAALYDYARDKSSSFGLLTCPFS